MNELLEALQVLNKYGLTVVDEKGKQVNKPKKKRPNKRPNGTGSIVKLSGTRRKPYGAFITTGYDENDGHQIQKAIGYYETREEAQVALDHWNFTKKKRNVGIRIPTFKDIYDIVYENEIKLKSDSTIINYNSAFKRLQPIHNVPIDEITLHQLQPIFDNLNDYSKSSLLQMKVVCSCVFNYAMKYDYIDKDYSSYIDISKHSKEQVVRNVFTESEIQAILDTKTKIGQLVVLSIYTGMRPIEMVSITRNNVHEHYMIGGAKTKAGKGRIIPIHDNIRWIVQELMDQGFEYLCYECGNRTAYVRYRRNFIKLMEELEMDHMAYDTRHTFATLAKEYELKPFAVKKIMGHSCRDITDDVYTHAPSEYLLKEVNKIKAPKKAPV